jgi:hypothetical protein
MKFNILPILLLGLLFSLPASPLVAQDGSAKPSEPKKNEQIIQFNGLGRAYLLNTDLGGEIMNSDTVSPPNNTDGEFLLDLQFNAQPNDVTEIQTVLRLRNEFGGFFGSGVSVEVRELWARGIIANTFKYRVGDFDHVQTPYTFYNFQEEGMINEAEVFRPQREVVYYEQFYQEGNTRRMQGASLDFGFTSPVLIQNADFKGYFARIRTADFFSLPSRFVTGGRMDLLTQTFSDSLGTQAKIGANLVHTFDDMRSAVPTESGIRNTVWSVDFDVALVEKAKWGIHVEGEAGASAVRFLEATLLPGDTVETRVATFEKDGTFLDAGISFDYKPAALRVKASFIDIGPDFFSMGAQSRRIDLERNKSFYNRIGNDRDFRMPTIFDINRDRALYTYQLSDVLMPYDPRFSNVMPFGQATPNRRGFIIDVEHGDSESPIEASVRGAFLQEIRGQGTFELKDFRQIRAIANLNIHNMLDWRKNLRVTLGWQNEQTNRGGIEVEQIDFASNLLDVGLEAELFLRFDLLLGAKIMNASGREYIPRIDEYNVVTDFPEPYVVDDQEMLLGGGFRYRFKEGVYLTLQYQQFSFDRAIDPANNYDIRQVFVLYNMDF